MGDGRQHSNYFPVSIRAIKFWNIIFFCVCLYLNVQRLFLLFIFISKIISLIDFNHETVPITNLMLLLRLFLCSMFCSIQTWELQICPKTIFGGFEMSTLFARQQTRTLVIITDKTRLDFKNSGKIEHRLVAWFYHIDFVSLTGAARLIPNIRTIC